MSTSRQSIEFLEDQLQPLDVRTAPMFGEYCVYLNGKVVGFVCEDVFFIKPSPADPALFAKTVPAPPYPGAKDYHSVPGDLLEDVQWLVEAVQATADALPFPKPKKRKVQ